MYDLIGDIHGQADELKMQLKKLGYEKNSGVYRHPERQAIFVGDFIDRGNKILETLEIVKSMTDSGSALAVIGNHEFNFLCYNVKLPDGKYLRPHNKSTDLQVKETVNQFNGKEKLLEEYLSWFRTLPLYMDLGDIRVCHACWDDDNINILKNNKFNLSDNFLTELYSDRESSLFKAIDETLKGKEIQLQDDHYFYDRYNERRTKMRIMWCLNPAKSTYGEYYTETIDSIKDEKVDLNFIKYTKYYEESNPPVFFGHYGLKSDMPEIKSENAVCVDFSKSKNGFYLTAYSWNGEQKVSNDNFRY